MDRTVEKILIVLKARGKQQKDLVEYLGINKQSVSDWKTGKTKSYSKYLKEISEFLNVSVEDLVNDNTIVLRPAEDITPAIEDGDDGTTGFITDISDFGPPPDMNYSGLFNSPAVLKAYNSLTEREKLEIQIAILDKAAASEKSNATVTEIKKEEASPGWGEASSR